MSQSISISSLRFIKPKDLSQQLLDAETQQKVAVIDVRDNDYLGGHVKGSIHAPVDQLDARMPELLRVLADKEQVVFHCMLSQQRGPKSALAYARARAKQAKAEGDDDARSGRDTRTDGADGVDGAGRIGGQEICVLEGGFEAWQKAFGEDRQLTEGYIKELWDAELI